MSEVVIQCEGIGKRYRIRHEPRERYRALRDVIADTARNIFRRRTSSEGPYEDFWALKDVSFSVKEGDVVGIIGRNGAGKSTLLKILSRITEPSAGRVTLNGRVASLLEVGTGFHPELTGRENIYLNGAILGMSRMEIRSKFDEIVNFAEVERFLDTPVKRYSSGMYVRLAFAVAAHLEPDVLIIDEVLAVGDAEFQRKCLGKMREVSTAGRTVLFVSHQMAAIQNLCQVGILLSNGAVTAVGDISQVVNQYLSDSEGQAAVSLKLRRDRQGTGDVRFTSMELIDEDGRQVAALSSGRPAKLQLGIELNGQARSVHVSVGIDSDIGQRIALLSTTLTRGDFPWIDVKRGTIDIVIPRLPFMPGRYGFTLFCSVGGEVADWLKNAGMFNVEPGDFYGTGQLPPAGQGYFMMDHRFTFQPLEEAGATGRG